MNTPTYDESISALLVVDPYNDFISEGGKIWPRIKAVAEANDCVSNMLKVPECRARSEASRLLCHASSVSCRRLRSVDLVSRLANIDYDLRYRVICGRDYWNGATNQAIKG